MFSVVGPHADGDVKDTAYNIQRTGEFVYNMATYDQRDAVNRTSSAVGRDVDEFQLAGLTKLESEQVAPCRVAESPVHMECKLLQVIQLPYRNPAVQVRIVLGEVVGIHIDDALIDAEGKVDITRAKPLARLGYKDYASIDAVFELARPK